MFEVHYSEVALADLDDIWGYITFELRNPDAAVNTVNGIIDAIDKLSEYHLSIQSHHLPCRQISLHTYGHQPQVRFQERTRGFSTGVIFRYRSHRKSTRKSALLVEQAF